MSALPARRDALVKNGLGNRRVPEDLNANANNQEPEDRDTSQGMQTISNEELKHEHPAGEEKRLRQKWSRTWGNTIWFHSRLSSRSAGRKISARLDRC